MVEKAKTSKVSAIRWTLDEHAFLTTKTKAWDTSISAFVRACIRMALGIPTIEEANIRRFQEIEEQLRGLARNFNQMTRAANAGKLLWTQQDADAVSDLSVSVNEARALLREYQKQASKRGFDKSSLEDLS